MTPRRATRSERGEDRLAPGLYLVATPIGNAADITLRALAILAGADLIAAEDTRRTRRLLAMHGVGLSGRQLVAYNDHSGPERRQEILARLAAGASVACVSDAGTPLVADPGYRLVEAAIAAGVPVHAVPGASAVMAALAVAGLPTDRFLFAGFPPPRAPARNRFLAELVGGRFSIVLYESPKRAAVSVASMARAFGADRRAALCRELTKRFEEVRRGTLGSLAQALASEPEVKGEIVIVIGPPPDPPAPSERSIGDRLAAAMAEHSLKDAVRIVAAATGAPRREVYRLALGRAPR
jgi:16S rRNA (cytidine1402-2'-O)-methyltransferase